jgi:hypothetical protein
MSEQSRLHPLHWADKGDDAHGIGKLLCYALYVQLCLLWVFAIGVIALAPIAALIALIAWAA